VAIAGVAALVLMNISIVVLHVITLPVEFDASFKRALPVLRDGRYLSGQDLSAARHILNAAAASLMHTTSPSSQASKLISRQPAPQPRRTRRRWPRPSTQRAISPS